jgi:diguanylate cyclase (GGDEF)-like protein/PAS domain S-box-containing protein
MRQVAVLDQYSLFIILAPLSLAASLGIGLYSWHHRKRQLARSLAVLIVPVCGYLVTNSLELLIPAEWGKVLAAKASYLFGPLLCVAWLAFSFDYVGKDDRLQIGKFWPYLLVPVITAGLAATNEWHHLIWRTVAVAPGEGPRPLAVSYGSWFWANLAFSYALLVGGAVITVREYLRSYREFRSQSAMMLIGMLFPLAAQIAYIFKLFPTWTKDYTPIGFAFAGIAFAVGIFHYRLFSLAPIARSLVMDYIREGICVVDSGGQIVDANAEFRRITGTDADRILGQRARTAMPFLFPDESPPQPRPGNEERVFVVELPCAAGRRSYEATRTELRLPRGRSLGCLITLHDVTERVRLTAEIEMLAITDPLTGLFNRRHFQERAQEEILRSERLEHSLSMAIIDLDFFKRVNDEKGHTAGDQVLAAFASLLQASFRKIDILARYGGDEFVALLPELGMKEAMLCAERLRSLQAASPCPSSAGEIRLTVSIGVAGFEDAAGLRLEEMVRRADLALYEAKRGGRNRVVAFE